MQLCVAKPMPVRSESEVHNRNKCNLTPLPTYGRQSWRKLNKAMACRLHKLVKGAHWFDSLFCGMFVLNHYMPILLTSLITWLLVKVSRVRGGSTDGSVEINPYYHFVAPSWRPSSGEAHVYCFHPLLDRVRVDSDPSSFVGFKGVERVSIATKLEAP